MNRVDQTTFGEKDGNCFSACVASIMEIPLAEVPFFMIPDGWWEFFLEWLRPRGYYALCFDVGNWNTEQASQFVDGLGLHILSGKSPRGEFDHSIVADGVEIIHDPHPSRDGIDAVSDIIIIVRGIQ